MFSSYQKRQWREDINVRCGPCLPRKAKPGWFSPGKVYREEVCRLTSREDTPGREHMPDMHVTSLVMWGCAGRALLFTSQDLSTLCMRMLASDEDVCSWWVRNHFIKDWVSARRTTATQSKSQWLFIFIIILIIPAWQTAQILTEVQEYYGRT